MFTLGSFKRLANRERASGDALAGLAQRYGLMAMMAVAIIYGSLYPFAFHVAGSLGADISHLATNWKQPPQSRGDLLANLLLYMPLGFATVLAFDEGRKFAIVFAPIAGGFLSLTMELAQFYDAGRFSAFSDVYLNVAGTAAGAGFAWIWGARMRTAWPANGSAAFARILLLAWLGWRLFPYEPTIDMQKYWRAVAPLLFVSHAGPQVFVRYTILWLSAIFMVQTGFGPKNLLRVLLVGIAIFFAAKIVIIGQSLYWPEIAGVGAALVLTPFILRRFHAIGLPLLAVCLLAVVVLTKLLPWHFATTPNTFQWIPFFGLLQGSLQGDIIAFWQKAYLFGVLLLLLEKAGMKLGVAAVLECVVLLTTSALQILMAGRPAEITDALMALSLALLYWLLRSRFRERARAMA